MTNQEQYAITMDQLNDPQSWDVPGIIADISQRMLEHEDGAAAAACIDNLCFAIQKIDKLIRTGPIINAKTIGEAAEVCARFGSRA